MSERSVKKRALRGSAWTLGGYGFSKVLHLSGHLILAWLLAPEIFGLMALVAVFMLGLNLFSDFGIGPSIIQSKRGRDPAFLNTAWTIQLIRGFGLWIVTCLLAWPFASWYAQNDPTAWQLSTLLPVAALGAVIAGFNSTAFFTLNKDLKLGRITIMALGGQVISLVVMVGWALQHPTVWALVAGNLAGTLFKMVASHFLVPGYRMRPQWDRGCSRELFKFGKWIFLSTAFTFLASNLDRLVLGQIMSLADLGIYSIALVFTKVALDVSSRLGDKVMFPVYSKYQHQPDKLMNVALRAREVILWASAAVCICIAVGGPLFFETLWDPRYHKAGTIAQWLAIYVWAQILRQSIDRIPLALGNSRALFFSNFIQTGGIATAVGGYFAAGLPGFIVGLAFGPIAAFLFLLNYLPSQRLSMFMQSIRFTVMGGGTAALVVGFTLWTKSSSTQSIWTVSVVLGALVPLLLSAWVVYHRIYDDQ